MKKAILTALLMMGMTGSNVYASLGDSELQRDPFSRFKAQQALKEQPQSSRKRSPVSTWKPKLLATIVSGENSMINIDGKIVRLGEKINRYRLVEVSRYHATLQRNDQLLKLKLYSSVNTQ